MTVQDRNKAWGFALFGDDARTEIGGKQSLMGLYQADMIFPSTFQLPAMIPKFLIQIMYYERVGSLEGDFFFRVTYGAKNETILEAPVIRNEMLALGGTEPDDAAEQDNERIFHIRLPIVLSPFPVQEWSRVRVRVHYADGAILKLGSIALKQIPDADFQLMMTGNQPPSGA